VRKSNLKQFVLDHFQSVYASASCQLDTDAGDLLIELTNGQKVAVIVINRAVLVAEVRERYEKNTAHKIHTLFLLDQRMMPSDLAEVEPSIWMLSIHNLTNGRIYSYSCDGRTVTIRPLHFGWKWRSKIRHVQYGVPVDTSKLMPRRVEATFGAMDGLYATADFSEGVFWIKQEPRGTDYNYYSWRNWQYTERKDKKQNQADDEPNTWEDFERRHGFYEEPAQKEEPRRKRQTPPRTPRPQSDRMYYDILGVAVGTSLDEVKQAYRRKAREYHPDLHPQHRETYTAKMADINTAFEAISKKLAK